MTPPDPRLQRLLGGPALAGLRQRLRRHFERGGPADGVLHLGELQPAEHEALALLSGRPARPARSLRLDLADAGSRLQAAGIAGSLREALEQLDGPITDLAAQRSAARTAWSGVLARPGREARLQAWLQTPSAVSLLKRLARSDAASAEQLLAQGARVLDRLPAAGLPRAQLAARTLGDAHALDAGRPVASLVLAAWRHAEAAQGVPAADPAAEERARDTWARAGVLVNELARPVLVLNLPARPGPEPPPWLPGEPAYLSLRWLLRAAPGWQAAAVHVCENPNLLAIAADRLGERCAPLVCTDGMPAAAQRTLLDQLRQAGARLRCHADFDWAGLRIANHLLRSTGAAPWRMGTADYEAAARGAAAARHALSGPEAEAAWDAALTPAMRRHGLAIAEEAVAESLLGDLSRP
ncbi:MAG TPA: TIGR02679 family protein [Rubrivivax sp.]|nr:TIGR02679 family protein [Rubrivivax sp.]